MGARSGWVISAIGMVGFVVCARPVLGWQSPWGSHPYTYQYRAPAVLGPCIPGSDWGVVEPGAAGQVLRMLAAVRAGLGLRLLANNPALNASAVWKSLHMARFDYFEHDDKAPPVARSPFQRAVDCGYGNRWIGVVIAAGQSSAQEAVADWLASPGHRRIIEGPEYSEVGVGVAQSPQGRIYWTIDLGRGGT